MLNPLIFGQRLPRRYIHFLKSQNTLAVYFIENGWIHSMKTGEKLFRLQGSRVFDTNGSLVWTIDGALIMANHVPIYQITASRTSY